MRSAHKILVLLFLCALGAVSSSPFAQAAVTGYTALGDSITNGYPVGATARWPQLVANQVGLTLTDPALIGDGACDVFPRQILSHGIATHAQAATLYSLMVGTNDVDTKGIGAYEGLFSACHLADLAWLVIPRENMILAGDAGMSGSGAWSASPDSGNAEFTFGGAYASGPGTLSVSPVVAQGLTGGYVFYTISDTAPASASFDIWDETGVRLGTYSARPSAAIATQNGTRTTIAAARLPLTAGRHLLTLSTLSGGVSVLAVGTLPSMATSSLSTVLSGDLPNQAQAAPVASEANLAAYNADVRKDEGTLITDGAMILHVPNRQYMLGTPGEMAPGDSLHLSVLGNQNMAAAFLATLQQIATVQTGTSASSATNTTTQFCGSDCVVNDGVDAVLTFGSVTLTLPVVPHGQGGRRISVTSFGSDTVTTVVQPAGWNLFDPSGQVQQVIVQGGHTRFFQSYTAAPTDKNWFVFVQ